METDHDSHRCLEHEYRHERQININNDININY
jgi:hypothetical protein